MLLISSRNYFRSSGGRFHKLIYALRQTIYAPCLTFEKLFTGKKVWRKAQKIGIGCKTVYEIDP